MANIIEIVEMLRASKEVVIQTKHAFTVMQQMQEHSEKVGPMGHVEFKPHAKKGYTELTMGEPHGY